MTLALRAEAISKARQRISEWNNRWSGSYSAPIESDARVRAAVEFLRKEKVTFYCDHLRVVLRKPK